MTNVEIRMPNENRSMITRAALQRNDLRRSASRLDRGGPPACAAPGGLRSNTSRHRSVPRGDGAAIRRRGRYGEERFADGEGEWTRLLWAAPIQPGRAGPPARPGFVPRLTGEVTNVEIRMPNGELSVITRAVLQRNDLRRSASRPDLGGPPACTAPGGLRSNRNRHRSVPRGDGAAIRRQDRQGEERFADEEGDGLGSCGLRPSSPVGPDHPRVQIPRYGAEVPQREKG